jgi:hypothetical protein
MIRKLNTEELRILKSLYQNSLDFEKIKISNEHIFSYLLKKYSAIVFDNTIIFSKQKYKDDFSRTLGDMSLLVHEVCHVWQFQNLNYRWFKAGFEHIKYKSNTYKYKITDHKKLTDFRFEQQGEIMADYYRKKEKNDTETEIYERVIYSVIKFKNN